MHKCWVEMVYDVSEMSHRCYICNNSPKNAAIMVYLGC